ncbi:MAG: gliding motility-associated C-terminal domain-containing protein [Bacteroidota bacterium]
MGQKQGDNWLFGNQTGVSFIGGISPIATGKLVTQEGCSGYSDPQTGQLLFYTDGDSIWDKNNNVMPNGVGLGGHNSSTQSALVVPKPGSSTQFYVFTTGAWAGLQPGLSSGSFNLNTVDMTLNGGAGDIVVKNQTILSPVCEKLTATLDCNGVDYWVVVHKWNSNEFYSYLLTSSGLSAVPVISSIGYAPTTLLTPNGFKAIGYMKISPDGKKLAVAYFTDSSLLEIFDFDYSTGVVSNQISDNNWAAYPTFSGLYGLAFSPDNSKLYVTASDGITLPSAIFQYDLSLGTSAAILASKILIRDTLGEYYGALQLAPNGKIYLAKINGVSLDVIDNPNANGAACNFILNGLTMGSGDHLSSLGLPNFVEIFNTSTQFQLSYNGCGGNHTVTLLDTIIPMPVTVVWNFGDPASGVNNTSNLLHPTHQFSSMGAFNISLTVTAGCMNFIYNTTLIVSDSVTGVAIPDTAVCIGSSVQLVASGGIVYSCFNDPTLSNLNISDPIAAPTSSTTYFVIVSVPGCGTDTTTVTVTVFQLPAVDAGNDTSIIAGSSILINATSDANSFIWKPGESLNDSTILQPNASPSITTTYTVTVVSDSGCMALDTVVITVNESGTGPALYFPNAFSPNEDGLNDLFDYFNYGFSKVLLRIYNRWGQMVYETDLFHDGWDGKFNDLDCSMGVYIYTAVATAEGKQYFYKGNFTLIR